MAPDEIAPQPQRALSNTESAAMILFGRLTAFAITVALPILLAHKLTPAALGLYKQVFLVVNTALNLAPLGFGTNLYYFLHRDPARGGGAVVNTLLVLGASGTLAGLLVVLWPSVLTVVSREPEILRYAPLIGVTIVLWILSTLMELLPIANQEMKLAMVISIAGQIVRTALFLTAAVIWGTVTALAWAGVLYGAFAVGAVLWYTASRFPGYARQIDFKLLRQQLSYAVPLGLVALVWYFQHDLHNYFVSNQVGAALFAVYSVGCFQVPVVQLLSESASSVLIGQMARMQQENQTEEILLLTLRAIRKLAAVLFPIYAFLMVTGQEFIEFLFSEQYSDSWPIFRINLTLLPLGALVSDPVLRAYAEHRFRLLRIRLVLLAILVVALWWATPRYGMIGAITSVVVISAADRVTQAWIFGRVLGFGRRHLALLGDPAKLAVSAALAALLAFGVHLMIAGSPQVVVLAACGAVFAPVYLALVKLFGVVEPNELLLLRRAVLGPIREIGRRVGWIA